jgi:L-malate glycosyltransferase
VKGKRKKEKIDKKIKITYLVDFFRTINAGTERQLGQLLTRLPDMGYSVKLMSLQNSFFLRDEAPGLFPKISIITLGAQSDISKSIPSLFRLYSHLRNDNADIVQTFFTGSNNIGIIIAKLSGKRILISSRRDMGFNFTAKDVLLNKAANRFVSCIIANSEAVRKKIVHLEGIADHKIQVIYNGIKIDNFAKIAHSTVKRPIIGIVANLNRPVKRVDLFIKAAAQVQKKIPEVTFWIAGDGHLRKYLEKLATELGVPSVTFLGRVSNVKRLLNKMTIGVIASDSEGFSNSIMEYMEAGLPVIATDTGGNAELVQGSVNGLLIPPNNPDALANAMFYLLDNIEKGRQMGKNGRFLIERKFNIDKMINQTSRLYQSLLSH